MAATLCRFNESVKSLTKYFSFRSMSCTRPKHGLELSEKSLLNIKDNENGVIIITLDLELVWGQNYDIRF